MSVWIRIAGVSDIHEQHGTLVNLDGEDIVIFKVNGEYFALNNVCAHQHFSMLHQGMLEDCTVSCPMHGWTYDLRTGRATTGQGSVAAYNVKIDNKDIFIERRDVIS